MKTHGADSQRAQQAERAQDTAFRGQGTYGSGGSYGVGGGFEDPRDGRPIGALPGATTRPDEGWELGGAREPERGPFYGVAPRGYTRSDERIHDEVCELLMRHGYIDPSRISVRVERGEVILEGEVDSRRDKHELERMVAGVLAVQDIDNRLRIARTS